MLARLDSGKHSLWGSDEHLLLGSGELLLGVLIFSYGGAAEVREQAKISSHQGINPVHQASTLMVLSLPLSTNSRCFKGT